MDRFDRVVVALGRRWSRVLRVASVGFGVLFASTIATNSAAADCSQITGWSNQDATFFPVERVTRIDRSNAPGRFYFKMDSEQEKTVSVHGVRHQDGPGGGHLALGRSTPPASANDQPVGTATGDPVRGNKLGGAVLAMKACTALCMKFQRSTPWRRQVS